MLRPTHHTITTETHEVTVNEEGGFYSKLLEEYPTASSPNELIKALRLVGQIEEADRLAAVWDSEKKQNAAARKQSTVVRNEIIRDAKAALKQAQWNWDRLPRSQKTEACERCKSEVALGSLAETWVYSGCCSECDRNMALCKECVARHAADDDSDYS